MLMWTRGMTSQSRQHRQTESDLEFDRILWAANQSSDQLLT